jgi:hypothetical protein
LKRLQDKFMNAIKMAAAQNDGVIDISEWAGHFLHDV